VDGNPRGPRALRDLEAIEKHHAHCFDSQGDTRATPTAKGSKATPITKL
jgi:hypothetical protein